MGVVRLEPRSNTFHNSRQRKITVKNYHNTGLNHFHLLSGRYSPQDAYNPNIAVPIDQAQPENVLGGL